MPKRFARHLLSCLVALVALWLLAGCRLAPAEEPRPAAPAADAPRAATLEAARSLPAHTLALAVTDDLESLADELGRQAIVSRFRRHYERAVFELVQETGWQLLSPEGIADLGVEVAGPAAAALVLLEGRGGDPFSEQAALLMFTLAEPDRFKTELYRMATRLGSDPPVVVEEAVILGGTDVAVMVEGDRGFLVSSRGDARAACAELARLQPGDSLAEHPPFQQALAALGTRARVSGYLDLRGLAYAQLGLDPRWGGTSLGEALRHLERAQSDALGKARERSASVDDLVAIDDRFARRREALLERGEVPWLRGLLGAVGASAFALAPRPDGIDLRMVTDVPDGALLSRLLVRKPTRLPLDGAGEKVAGLELHLDPAVLLELVGLAAGEDAGALETTLGFRLAELSRSLSGALGLVLTLPPGGFGALGELGELGGTAVLGLREEAAARKLLDRLVAEHPEVVKRAGDHYAIVGLGVPVSVELQGGAFRVSKAAGPGEGDGKPSPSAAAKAAAPASSAPQAATRPARLVARPGNAAAAYVRLGLAMLDEAPRALPSKPMEAVPWHDPAVPKSDAYQAKLAELVAVGERVSAVEARIHAGERRRFAELLEPLGGLGIALWHGERGVALEASYRTGSGTLVDAVAELIEREREPASASALDQAELGRLEAERSKLDAELEAIYLEDVNKQEGGVAVPTGGSDG